MIEMMWSNKQIDSYGAMIIFAAFHCKRFVKCFLHRGKHYDAAFTIASLHDVGTVVVTVNVIMHTILIEHNQIEITLICMHT